MTEPKWKLGEDMHQSDNIFDPITFEQIITDLRCGSRVLDYKAVNKVAMDIFKSRWQDFMYLLERNTEEIIAEAKKGRN
jgi:hypothetical protein